MQVKGLSKGVESVSPAFRHTCATLETGGVKCWGDNSEGELGDGTLQSRLRPVDASTLIFGARAVAAGSVADHTCAVTEDFRTMCWGANFAGQLGDGTTKDRKAAVRVKGGLIVTTAAVGAGYTCAVTQSGKVWCWGENSSGQLGDGTGTSSTVPVTTEGF